MTGITFNNEHSFNDYGLMLISKKISTPSKKKIKEAVPGMSSYYDFSTVASDGEIVYNQRTLVVNFVLMETTKDQMQIKLDSVIRWIQDVGQKPLIFDDISDFYFMAEVEGTIDIAEKHSTADLSVTFTAEPFKTGIDFAVDQLWDTFNFETDYLQDGGYDVVTTQTIPIYNPGRPVMPLIHCSAAMSIVFTGVTYPMAIGNNIPYGLKLLNGINTLTVNGTGRIEFSFRKVVL
ncbi:distal tail protein Dit [Acetobacterium sp.]|uniref:distal tail protein Dit n=1 Tax=Acetobacterium sp. TaxID=1872094 RepID=UPI002F3FEAAC